MNPQGVVNARRDPADYLAHNSALAASASEYERTKADHAKSYGCDRCTVGAASVCEFGWRWHPEFDLPFCPRCKNLSSARRMVANAEAALADRAVAVR